MWGSATVARMTVETSDTSGTGEGEDWLAGATIEFFGDIEEPAQVALDGIDFSRDGNES